LRTHVTIIDFKTAKPVEAEVFDEVTVDHFLEAQQEWRPIVLRAARELARRGARELIPQHLHWDWTSKAPQLNVLANIFYGVSYDGKLQGLMKVETVGEYCRCRLPEQDGKPLVYVDYLEVAPWNLKPLAEALGNTPRFKAVGSRLVEAAVLKSVEEEFKGRVGLHSLPMSEQFYLRVCGMTAVGRDVAKQNLLWLEYTPEQAGRFLSGVRKP